MSASKNNMSAEEIEANLERKVREMEDSQHNGNYVEAQNCRVMVEQLKKDFQARKLYELNAKHKHENSDLSHTHNEEMEHFNKFWDKKMEEFYGDGQRLERDMA